MFYIVAAFLWPAGAVALYFLQPILLPGTQPPKPELLAVVALTGMAAFTFAGALRLLGFLRNDRKKREKSRAEAEREAADDIQRATRPRRD